MDRLNETLLFGFQALPAFQREFGDPVTSNSALQWTLSAEQQELLSESAVYLGVALVQTTLTPPQVIYPGPATLWGLCIYGYVTDRIGSESSHERCAYRRSILDDGRSGINRPLRLHNLLRQELWDGSCRHDDQQCDTGIRFRSCS